MRFISLLLYEYPIRITIKKGICAEMSFRTLDPRPKEKTHTHPSFDMRDITVLQVAEYAIK